MSNKLKTALILLVAFVATVLIIANASNTFAAEPFNTYLGEFNGV